MKPAVLVASNKPGRVLLHLLCGVRCPCHAAWHWQGILREFKRPRLRPQSVLSLPLTAGLLLGFLMFSTVAFAQSVPSRRDISFAGPHHSAKGQNPPFSADCTYQPITILETKYEYSF
jgi:hypothetical protein